MAYGLHVDPQLVGAPGQGFCLQQGGLVLVDTRTDGLYFGVLQIFDGRKQSGFPQVHGMVVAEYGRVYAQLFQQSDVSGRRMEYVRLAYQRVAAVGNGGFQIENPVIGAVKQGNDLPDGRKLPGFRLQVADTPVEMRIAGEKNPDDSFFRRLRRGIQVFDEQFSAVRRQMENRQKDSDGECES